MSIRIVNLRNYKPVEGEILIKVDRSTVLGNPYFMKSECMRDKVCEMYERYFNICMGLDGTQPLYDFKLAVDYIVNVAKNQNVALGCWCYPKRCHAETIKKFVEKKLNESEYEWMEIFL